MNILIVNGIVLPEPTGMDPTEQDITKSNRSVTGYMKGHVVRHDVHTLQVSWKLLSADDYHKISQAIQDKYGLKVYYHLPEKNKQAEITAYVGDRCKKTYWYRPDGKPVYKDVTMKFIEE